MVLGNGALAHERGGHRRADMLGDRHQFGAGAGRDDAAAGQDDRALRGEQQSCGLGDVGGVAEGAGRGASRVLAAGLDDRGFGLQILRQVDHHGPAAAVEHGVERLVQDGGQLLDAARLPPALHRRLGHAGKIVAVRAVEFLQHAAVRHVGVHAAGDEQLRHRIGERGGEPGQRVGGTRPDGGGDGVDHPQIVQRVHATTIFIGLNQWHSSINDGDGPMTWLWLMVPHGLEGFFRAIGRPRGAGEAASEPFARPDDVIDIERVWGFAAPRGAASEPPAA